MVELKLNRQSTVILIINEFEHQTEFEFIGFHKFKRMAQLLLAPIVSHMELIEPISAQHICRNVGWIDKALIALNVNVMPSNETSWSRFVIKLHEYIFTNQDCGYNLWSRSRVWTGISQILNIWKNEKIIPYSTYFPPTERVKSEEVASYRDKLLGQKPMEVVTNYKLNKLIGAFEISISDEDYFDNLGNNLAFLRNVVRSVLEDYWGRIKANYEFGKQLISNVQMSELTNECFNFKTMGRQFHPADYQNGITGLQNLLALSKFENHGDLISIKSKNAYRKIRGSVNAVQTYRAISSEVVAKAGGLGKILYENIFSNPVMPPNFVTQERLNNRRCAETRQTFNWMLGNLSTVDVAVICGLLMMLNPKFTPSAILTAKITDKNNKNYLLHIDGIHTFSIEKRRAKDMKTSTTQLEVQSNTE